MSYRVAMDIGGTFTDFVVMDEEAQVTTAGKTSTTPASPEQGVLEGLGHGLDEVALTAARAATFEPGTRCGKPTSATFVIAMRFAL